MDVLASRRVSPVTGLALLQTGVCNLENPAVAPRQDPAHKPLQDPSKKPLEDPTHEPEPDEEGDEK
jgi:hypothetical protein